MKINFSKLNGIVPAVIQDVDTLEVLMLGFMNQEALEKTIQDKIVTFFSRSKNRLWQKGESSGNFLEVITLDIDCDNDSILITAKPKGPVCHKGAFSCFGKSPFNLLKLFELLRQRKLDMPKNSYTSSLFWEGMKKILAKVEEETKEVVKAAQKEGRQRLIEESCDLLYHLFVLLNNEDIDIASIEAELSKRNNRLS